MADRRNGDTDTRLGLVRDDLDTARYLLEKHLQETDGVLPEAIANGAYSVRVEDDGSLTFVTLGLKFGASQGTAGQLLTSAGAGVAPAWADPPGGGGSIITVAHGGTGQDFSAVARGSVIYFSAAGAMSTLAPGTAGYVLSTNGAGADPAWVSVAGAGGVTGSGTANKVAKWTSASAVGNSNATDDGTTYTIAEKTVVSAGGFQSTGSPGGAAANTGNTDATINVAAGSHSGANDNIASVDFYRSSTFKGAVGMDAGSAATIAGHTHVNTDFWVIGQSGNYSIVIGVDDKVYLKDALLIGAGLSIASATMITTRTSFTDGAAANIGTLTNAPAAGDPTKWIPINDNGTTRYIPAW